MKKTRKLITTGVFVALGIIFPQIFHLIGGNSAGGIFLPMHIPVFLAGFIAGPLSGLITGLLSPLISFLLTGMPPMPMLLLMLFELPAYGISAGILYKKKKMNIYLSLLMAMVIGRCFYSIAIFVLGKIFMLNIPAGISVTAAFSTGIPGIIIQMLLIPAVIKILEIKGLQND
ncbi:MAG: ECF transporter S component [Thermotogae bacterium]|nr:ECF transporter S component [Thermotogota bacterium]MCP5465777.1 ECF transporter S component [Thermotogota bacterium]HOO73902.1 ECF transporter S component [Tepiditoga sp.]